MPFGLTVSMLAVVLASTARAQPGPDDRGDTPDVWIASLRIMSSAARHAATLAAGIDALKINERA